MTDRLPTALVLASGRGERFLASGGTTHKLQARLGDKTVLQHALDAVRASGLPWHLEDGGHPGMGDSIAAAVRATPQACGWLIVLGDLPLIQAATLQALAQALSLHDVVIPTYQGQRGHPVGFSARCRGSLLSLTGDRGAAGVVKLFGGQFGGQEIALDDRGIVSDIDTVEDLDRVARLMASIKS